MRRGLSERWELRIGLPEFVDGPGESGVSDASIGVKYEAGSVGQGELALIAELSVPIGDDEFTSCAFSARCSGE